LGSSRWIGSRPRDRRLRGAVARRHCDRREHAGRRQHVQTVRPMRCVERSRGVNAGRILIIEDEAALLRGLVDTFRSKGYEVASAADGEAGLELALSSKPDLIILDLMLPAVNGYEICRSVRERGADMPI